MRTIRGATRAFTGLFVLAMIALVLGAFYGFYLGWRQKDAALFTHAEDLITATDAKEAFERSIASARGYLLAGDPISIEDRDRGRRDLQNALAVMQQRALGRDDRVLLDDAVRAIRAHDDSLDRVILQRGRGDVAAAARGWQDEVLPRSRVARGALAQLVEYRRGQHEEASERARQAGERAALLMLSVAAGVFFVGVIGALLLGRSARRVYDRETVARAKAEEAQREADQARGFLGALLDGLPVGIVAEDRDGKLVHVSASAAALLGDGAPLDEVAAPLARGLAGEIVEQELETSAGRILATTAAPIRDADQHVVAAFAAFTDITDRKRGERERELFLAALGHDLRSPLQAIALSAGALLKRDGLDDAGRRTATRIAASADRMGRLIQQLLDFTRSQHGSIPIHAQRTDLVEVARDVVQGAELGAPGRDLRLEADGPVIGWWDGDRLAQVLQNLIGNALDYGAHDAPVRVQLTGRGDHVTIAISNHGETIPDDVQRVIFEPFRRGVRAASTRSAGLGLGLYIARAIVAAHGGAMALESANGVTTFWITLPRRARPPWRDQQQPASG